MQECTRSPGPSLLAYVTCTKRSWTVPKLLAWAIIYIPSFRDSLLAYALSTKLIKLDWAITYIPSYQCDLQRPWQYCANVQSRLILRCSHMWQVPNFLELAYKIRLEPSSTSLLFSAICKAQARLYQCAVSYDPMMFVYAISTEFSWTCQ